MPPVARLPSAFQRARVLFLAPRQEDRDIVRAGSLGADIGGLLEHRRELMRIRPRRNTTATLPAAAVTTTTTRATRPDAAGALNNRDNFICLSVSLSKSGGHPPLEWARRGAGEVGALVSLSAPVVHPITRPSADAGRAGRLVDEREMGPPAGQVAAKWLGRVHDSTQLLARTG
jgi:hypothetical protein